VKALILALVLATASGCAAPVSVVTPAGQVAYKADQIVIRVNELQNAAIQANGAGALPTDTTRLIVQFAVSADTVLATTPLGWQATVLGAWQQTKKNLPPTLPANVAALVQALDAVLGMAVGGGQ